MTKRLHRYYGTHDLHFITSSCSPLPTRIGLGVRRGLFVKILEEARRKYRFVVHGYVVMPDHFHLLITEPEAGDPSVLMKVIKERFSRRLNRKRKQAAVEQGVLWERAREPVWQKRFYDFNVWSARKHVEKLRYLHRNPVKRGLVERPKQWMWSSFRAYGYGETGPVRVKFQEWALEIKRRPVRSLAEATRRRRGQERSRISRTCDSVRRKLC